MVFIEQKALKILRSGEFSPFVVYISAPTASALSVEDVSQQILTIDSDS